MPIRAWIIVGVLAVAILAAPVVLSALSSPGASSAGSPGAAPSPGPSSVATGAAPSLGLPSAPGTAPPSTRPPASIRPPTSSPGVAEVLVGAGDIASCRSTDDETTAALLDGIAGTVFTLGDNAYPDGRPVDYADCFEPTWGRHSARMRPAPGNHDFLTAGGAGYFGYFGAVAGEPGNGWYSYELGNWHVIVLNANCELIGGCGPGSPQGQWLASDLAASDSACTLAMWHHPRFSSGYHGNDTRTAPFWDALYAKDADLIVNGHDHDYERFAPQDPGASSDPARGIRQLVAGTGGANLRPFETIRRNSEVRDSSTHGVLKLTLRAGGYDWEFVPVAGRTFTDSGSGTCH